MGHAHPMNKPKWYLCEFSFVWPGPFPCVVHAQPETFLEVHGEYSVRGRMAACIALSYALSQWGAGGSGRGSLRQVCCLKWSSPSLFAPSASIFLFIELGLFVRGKNFGVHLSPPSP